jgi:hypothetical protein
MVEPETNYGGITSGLVSRAIECFFPNKLQEVARKLPNHEMLATKIVKNDAKLMIIGWLWHSSTRLAMAQLSSKKTEKVGRPGFFGGVWEDCSSTYFSPFGASTVTAPRVNTNWIKKAKSEQYRGFPRSHEP